MCKGCCCALPGMSARAASHAHCSNRYRFLLPSALQPTSGQLSPHPIPVHWGGLRTDVDRPAPHSRTALADRPRAPSSLTGNCQIRLAQRAGEEGAGGRRLRPAHWGAPSRFAAASWGLTIIGMASGAVQKAAAAQTKTPTPQPPAHLGPSPWPRCAHPARCVVPR